MPPSLPSFKPKPFPTIFQDSFSGHTESRGLGIAHRLESVKTPRRRRRRRLYYPPHLADNSLCLPERGRQTETDADTHKTHLRDLFSMGELLLLLRKLKVDLIQLVVGHLPHLSCVRVCACVCMCVHVCARVCRKKVSQKTKEFVVQEFVVQWYKIGSSVCWRVRGL